MGPHAVWYRSDLRVDDHAPLRSAASRGPVVCVHCLDPRSFGDTEERGFPRTGPHRARFLLESLAALRHRLRQLGADLLVRRGRPEEVLPELAASQGWASLAYHGLVGTEEERVQDAVDAALGAAACPVERHWGATLVDPDELPFGLADLPEVFTRFRKEAERGGRYPAPLPAPGRLEAPELEADPGELPTLAEPEDDARSLFLARGGEKSGQERLRVWAWERDRLRRYKETRNGMLDPDDASRLSPWIALGCISPRRVQAEVERYETERVRNESTYWLTFELLWRDYFQLVLAKHGRRVFRSSGLLGLPVPWRHDEEAFERWRTGTTGFPLVDAGMRELDATGFLSNRGRQIVASFLTKNLGVDWRWGAEWFESRLVDHDVASNYGNWNYTAGVGNDARGFRYFHVPKQAERYDGDGRYVAHWCPELARLPAGRIHAPWTLSPAEQERYGVELGRDWPTPVVDLDESVREQRVTWEAAMGASGSRRGGRGRRRGRR